MKREYLEELGLTKEQVDGIMKQNGADIEAAKGELESTKTELEQVKAQLTEANSTIEGFKDYDEVKSQVEEYKTKYEQSKADYENKIADMTFTTTLENAISSAGGRNAKAVKAMLDIEALKTSKDQSADIKKALEAVKESDAYLFGANEPIKNPVGPSGSNAGGGTDSLSAMRAAMGLPEK